MTKNAFTEAGGQAQPVFLSPIIFAWHHWEMGGRFGDRSRIERSYSLLEHSERLIEGEPTEFEISDAVSNLKRAINVRLQLLEESYAFASAFPRNVGALERLQKVGLARPYLVKQLFQLRNDIEHEDAPPPRLEVCQELVDLTWYFLRATDPAVRTVQESLEFEQTPDTDPPGLWFEAMLLSVSERRMSVRGRFAPPFWSREYSEGLIAVHAHVSKPKRGSTRNSGDDESERYIHGEIILPSEVLYRFWQIMFS